MPWPRWWSSSQPETGTSDASVVGQIKKSAQDMTHDAKEKLRDADSKTISTVASFPRAFAEPQTILATAVLTSACLICFKLYRTYLRRIPEATNIHQSYFRRRSILGKVTSVGDGDNFRIYHTPGGWLTGWGWLPWRRVPSQKKLLKNNTIHVRIAGIDAPELAHFGRPSQPYSQEALNWLTSYLRGRRVRTYVYKIDQYSRVVATAYVWKGFLKRDIGLQMLRAGLATVYEAKTGAEFGEGLEEKYRAAETWAKSKKKGMWAGNMTEFESPREYKNKFAHGEQSTKR